MVSSHNPGCRSYILLREIAIEMYWFSSVIFRQSDATPYSDSTQWLCRGRISDATCLSKSWDDHTHTTTKTLDVATRYIQIPSTTQQSPPCRRTNAGYRSFLLWNSHTALLAGPALKEIAGRSDRTHPSTYKFAGRYWQYDFRKMFIGGLNWETTDGKLNKAKRISSWHD